VARGTALRRGANLALRGPRGNPPSRRSRAVWAESSQWLSSRAVALPSSATSAVPAAFFVQIPTLPFPRESSIHAVHDRAGTITAPQVLLNLSLSGAAVEDDGG